MTIQIDDAAHNKMFLLVRHLKPACRQGASGPETHVLLLTRGPAIAIASYMALSIKKSVAPSRNGDLVSHSLALSRGPDRDANALPHIC